MAVRLRYLAHDLEVPPGHFVIGRSADCQLSLEDALVSRRHALLGVGGQGAFIEDIGSRNGVFVNGVRIHARMALADGDRITIGSQEMSICITAEAEPEVRHDTLGMPAVHDARPGGGPPPSRSPSVRGPDSQRRGGVPEDSTREHHRSAVQSHRDSADPPTGEYRVTAGVATSPDRRVNALTLIGSVADKALAMGRTDEATRILYRSLVDVLAKAREGEAVGESLAETAAQYAARLGAATGRGEWVDYIFELYTVTKRLIPVQIVDELYNVLRKVKVVDMGVLQGYTVMLRTQAPQFGPTERFVQQRIEGLERLGALK